MSVPNSDGDKNDTLATDFGRWKGTAASSKTKDSWRSRAELASFFVRTGDTVCDLGAGQHVLKQVLPAGVGYIPVDCVTVIPGTRFVDFNEANYTLPLEPFNVVVALGMLNYLDSLESFFERLADQCENKFIIFTYDFWKLNARYRKHGVRNGIENLEEGVAFFAKYIRNLTPAIVLRRRVMFTGTIGRGNSEKLPVTPSATKIICEYTRPAEYCAMKLLKLDMMPRWLA